MNILTGLIKEDMKPALGVTEPGAIAFAVATARKYIEGSVEKVRIRLNSGMFKNAFTCGIPGISEVGNYYAAALGAVGADAKKGLECLDGITEEQKTAARRMVEDGRIAVEMSEITSRIYIKAIVSGEGSQTAEVTICNAHTNIVEISQNGKIVFSKETEQHQEAETECLIHHYTLAQIYEYVLHVPAEELEFIKEAFAMNEELLMEGLHSEITTYGPYLLEANGGKLISEDERKTASLFCNGAIEARVLGLSRPAMSITGSGAHGIIATMPLYAAYAAVDMAFKNVYIYNVHGINGSTPEETMKNMGLIASPGMTGTEKTIVDILEEKAKKGINA